jgi:hypothetical protein
MGGGWMPIVALSMKYYMKGVQTQQASTITFAGRSSTG